MKAAIIRVSIAMLADVLQLPDGIQSVAAIVELDRDCVSIKVIGDELPDECDYPADSIAPLVVLVPEYEKTEDGQVTFCQWRQ